MHINHHDLVCWLAGKVLLCVSFQPTILKITTTSHHLQQHFWKRKGWSWLLCAVVVTLTSPHLNDQVRRGLFHAKRSKSGLPTNDRMNHPLGCCPLNCFFLQVFFYFFYFLKRLQPGSAQDRKESCRDPWPSEEGSFPCKTIIVRVAHER